MTGAAWLGAALAFVVGAWLGRRRGDQRAADEALLREAAVDYVGAYVAQVKADQQEIKALRAQLDTTRAKTIKLGEKITWLESQVSSERWHNRRSLGPRFCAGCCAQVIEAEQTDGAKLAEVSP